MATAGTEVKYLNLDIPRKIVFALLFLLLFLLPALSYAGPSGKGGSSYWIKKLSKPDEAILNAGQIKVFNDLTTDGVDGMADFQSMPDIISGQRVFEWIWTDLLVDPLAKYDSRGRALPEGFFEELAWNMDFEDIPEDVEVRFGVITGRADVRGLPTDVALLPKPGRAEFDMIQYSSLYPAERVALLHTSRDNEWGFFQTGTFRGWIRMDRVAFGEREEVIDVDDGPFVVVTGSKVRVYNDRSMKELAGEAAMGRALYLTAKKTANSPWAVRFPVRDGQGALEWKEAYIHPRADVHQGFLPYTRRNIIKQAFKMLGEEYGWGGRDGLRDCSLFIQDVFATVGLKLPRNSRYQGLSGDVMAHRDDYGTRDDVTMALKHADPGTTLLTLSGHVMLHIGNVKGKPFVIHQIFGYADRRGMKRIGKVAVTGLDLGSRSAIGPMKKRLRGINRVTVPAQYGAKVIFDKST